MSNDLHFNIRLTYDDTGLKGMKAGIESIKKVMAGLNDTMPKMSTNNKRTIYGQLAGDVRSLGNAAEKAAPKIDRFVVSLQKFNTRMVTTALRDLNETSGQTVRATGNIITAQTKLRESLDRSTMSLRAANAATATMTKEQARAANAMAAQQRAETAKQAQIDKQANFPALMAQKDADRALKESIATQRQALNERKQQFREEQAILRQTQQAQAASAKLAQEQAQRIRAAYQRIISVVRELAQAIRSTLTSAIRSAGTALSSFGSTAAARFASLRTQLDATGKAFLRLGNDSRTAGTAFSQMWSGDTLIRTGRNLMQFVHQGQMMLRQTYTQFAGVEQSISRAAVAGLDIEDGRVTNNINMEQMWDFVYKTQRGEYGNTAIRSLTTQELADSIYYLTSAIGVGPDTAARQQGIANMVGPMAIWASATQTSPEEFIKGVLGIGQQFGYNPRAFETDPNTAQAFAGISGMVGYMANVSSMEPSDVISAMRMVGPSAFNAFGGMDAYKAGDTGVRERAMFDTFLAMFAASETGLRGSQVGRGYQRLFSGFADATPKTRALIMDALGLENTEAGYKEWLYDDNGVMHFGENGAGVLGIAKFLRDFKTQNGLEEYNDLIYGLFTENATRAMAATIGGMDSTMFKEIEKALDSGDFTLAYDLLEKVMVQETALISNAVTNMSNAWGQFANSIFRTSQDMIIGGLDMVANVFRELSDIIMDFPKIGQAIAGAFSGLMVGGGVIAGLLMIAGTLVSLQRAMTLIGISAGIVGKAFLTAIPFALMHVLPILLMVGAAIVALRTAWDNNFLGMRDAVTSVTETLGTGDFSTAFTRMLGTERFHEIYTSIMRVKAAFEELISGVFFNVGSTDNLGALLYSVFGRHTGSFLYENVIRLRFALSDLRGEISGFFSELSGNVVSNFPNFLKLFSGFLDIVLTGRHGRRGKEAANAIGELLGIENFDEQFQNFAMSQRENLFDVISHFVRFGGQVKAVVSDIGRNLSQVLTFDNLVAGLRAAMSFITGFAAGIGAAFLGALKAIELVTRAIANLGGAGRYVSELVRNLTGLEMTLNGVAQAIGAAVGFFVGSRFLAPLLLFNTALQRGALLIAGIGLSLAGMVAQVLGAVAGFGLLGGVIGIVGASLTLVLGAMFAYTAATQGMDAAIAGLSSAWDAFRGVMAETISNLSTFTQNVVQTALEIAGVSSNLLTFEGVGQAIGHVISVIAYAAAGAVGGIVLLGSAIFRIGREYGPALLSTLQGALPALGSLGILAFGAVAAVVQIGVAIYELVTAFLDAENVIVSFGAIIVGVWAAMNLPIAAAIFAIGSIGLAILSASGNFATFADSFDSMLDSMPVGMQKAVDGLVLTFLGGVDKMLGAWESFVNWVWGPLGIGDKYTKPENTLTYQYQVSRGMITPATHTPEQLQSYAYNATPQTLRDTIGGFEDQVRPIAERYHSEGYSVDESFAMARRDVYTRPDNAFTLKTQVAGIQAQNLNTVNSLLPMGGLFYGVSDTGELMVVGHAEQHHNIYRDKSGTGDGTGATLATFDSSDYWDTFAQSQGAPAGSVRTGEDFQKYFTSSRNLHSVPMGDDWVKLLPPELAERVQALEAWDDYNAEIQKLVSSGYTQQEAADLVDFNYLRAGMEIPPPPEGIEDWKNFADEVEEASYALNQANKQLYDAMTQMTDPFAATARYFDFSMGRGDAGGSGASYLNSVWDQISGNVGESEWWNQHELMADAAGLGFLGEDMYGVNAHDVLRPLFERVASETGVAYEDLVKDIPKWFAPEPVIALAARDIFKGIDENLSPELYNALDHGLNIDWSDLIAYAASTLR